MNQIEEALATANKDDIRAFLDECRSHFACLADLNNQQLMSFILSHPPPVPFSKTVEVMPVIGGGGEDMMIPLKHQVVNIDLQWCPSNLMRAWIDAWIDDAIINVRQ